MRGQASRILENLDCTWSEDSVRFINTPTPLARQLFYYVQEAGDFRTRAPYSTERANLDSFLIIYTLRGEGRLSWRGGEYVLVPGSAAFIHCMERHRYACPPGREWEFLWLHFNGGNALGYFAEFCRGGLPVYGMEEGEKLEEALREILALAQRKTPHAEAIISERVTGLLTRLLIASGGGGIVRSAPDYVEAALREIDRRFADALTLEDLARAVNVDKYHLAKRFKACVGVSPIEYVLLVRISRAKELLKYSRDTVEEISGACGFGQAGYFIRQFKKREGVTPLQYRRQWGENAQE